MNPRFLLFFFLILLVGVNESSAQEQEEQKPFSLQLDYFYGTIMEHNPDLSHLITDHPEGFVLSYNRKTYGFNAWERRYNYPDWGFTFTYQNFKNQALGENYGLYGHFNFYFLKRSLVLRIGQGIAYASNPYDRDENFLNNAYGTHLLSTTMLKFDYVKERLWRGLGLQAGFTVIHYSNANLKAPNNSTNTFAFSAGLNYQFDHDNFPEYVPFEGKTPYSEPVHFNLVLRGGVNESDIVGQGQFPFYVVSAFADKRINHKSTLQAGVDLFFAEFLKELIYFRSVAFPEENVTGDEDWKRVGIFIGHELRFNRVAFVSQLGYYVYYPFDFEGQLYNRLGLKRYFGKNDRVFAGVTVKAHGAKAEAVEFAVGIRFNKL
ncbi:acyloxyacyl hydrolase [Gilvibacter sediminis]|uniref:acyloxyacyl hydrolase n=1 Tax=Gilvibacter sediminis TaxID=379071 RepID=UPI0023508E63|nr:acyloxyacyl hydrolase [Gilvibacter sediminis]MDC7998683.1 acyloxyacyl hydrolase [Gilvibacter sediminis]